MDFQFIVYEAFKQPLQWTLVSGPSGMSLSQAGLLQWTPAVNQTGEHAVTIQVTRASGESISKSFVIRVNTNDFLFVALNGDDAANGSLQTPFRTIEHALRSVASGQGKTIYVRAGTYREHYQWEVNGVVAPTRGKSFSADAPLVLSSYPGEQAVLDCEYLGHGIYSTANYSIYKNFEVRHAGIAETAGANIQADYNVLQNITVRDSRWDVWDNVTGFKVQGGRHAVLDRCVAINNQDPVHVHWNSSNYLVYTDGVATGPAANIYILRSLSRDSFTGFKIKHAGPGYKLIVHDCRSEQDHIGFGGSSDYSSVRYSTFVNDSEGNINLGLTDPTSPVSNGSSQSYTGGSMLIEHNTMISQANNNLDVFGLYAGSSIIQKNIFYSQQLSGFQQFSVWMYQDDMSSLNLNINKNLYFNAQDVSASAPLFRWSRNNQTWAQWQARAYDTQGRVANPAWLDAHGNIGAQSPAVLNALEYAGAQPPQAVVATSTNLSSDVSAPVLGQNLTLTATVSAPWSGLWGQVHFYEGSQWLGSAPVATNGSAHLNLTAPAWGPHEYRAESLLAEGYYSEAKLSLLVQAATALNLSNLKPAAPKVGQTVVVRPQLTVLAPGSGMPSGVMTVSLQGNSCQFNWPVQAVPAVQWADGCSLPLLQPGNSPLTVQFQSADPNYRSVQQTMTLAVQADPLDSDGDGVPNALEASEGLNPNLKDNNLWANTAQGQHWFVQQQFRDLLFREASSTALSYWQNQMSQGLSRRQLMLNFVQSGPANNQIKPLVRLFLALFGRLDAGLSINGFVVYAQDLSAGRVTLDDCASRLLASSAFSAAFGSMDDAGFAQLVLRHVLGRSPSTDEVNAALVKMNHLGRAGYVRQRAEQADFVASSAQAVFLQWVYTSMARRVLPANAEAYWMSKLTTQPSAAQAELIDAFLGNLRPQYSGAANAYAARFMAGS